MVKVIDPRSWTRAQLVEVRKTAVELVGSGSTHEEVAELVGVSRETVTRWMTKVRQHGHDAILNVEPRGPKPGTQSILKPRQCATIVNLIIDRHPEQLKLPFVLWTAAAVQQLIKKRFGVTLAERTVREYLKRWGFTAQRPARRARERDDVQVEHWTRRVWPQYRAAAKKRGAVVAFVDETGIHSEETAGTSYAPRGRTPTVPVSGKRLHLNIITAITPTGECAFLAFRGRFNSEQFIDFLERLDQHCGYREMDIVLDNHSVHNSKRVKQWLKTKQPRVKLVFLPPYCPDLNPVEYMNNDLKTNWIRTLRPATQEELEVLTETFFTDLQVDTQRVQSYFEAKTLKCLALEELKN